MSHNTTFIHYFKIMNFTGTFDKIPGTICPELWSMIWPSPTFRIRHHTILSKRFYPIKCSQHVILLSSPNFRMNSLKRDSLSRIFSIAWAIVTAASRRKLGNVDLRNVGNNHDTMRTKGDNLNFINRCVLIITLKSKLNFDSKTNIILLCCILA